MKTLGIDYGDKRIGLAMSDDTGVLASPLPTLKVQSLADSVAKIQRIIKNQKVAKVVLGLPLGPKREETQKSIQIRYFADALKTTNGAQVEFWNEYYSTKSAMQNLPGGTKRKRKNLDSEAARIILQEYLDNQKNPKDKFFPQDYDQFFLGS
ncbi:MAG: Holliday junction resolvase RuvX [Candidatus Dojkabacteria bacterium]|jgi:putative Holliday junction resolvase|nr:Holliday junction resolvase RuvX [Candidatus Dojkabacteria bacterium]